MSASVELEGRLRAENVEVDFRLRVTNADQRLQWPLPGVKWQIMCIGIDNKTVIDIRLLRAKDERLFRLNAWEVLDGAKRYVKRIHRQMLRGMKGHLSALDRWTIT